MVQWSGVPFTLPKDQSSVPSAEVKHTQVADTQHKQYLLGQGVEASGFKLGTDVRLFEVATLSLKENKISSS